jgi:site-specific DNA-cytosine methylase
LKLPKNTSLDKLKNAGYNITPHFCKFEKYGVPQTRHRIIIVGIRNDLGKHFQVPSPGRWSNTCWRCPLLSPEERAGSGSRTPQEQESLQRQIQATDKSIDELVYQFYGLTD